MTARAFRGEGGRRRLVDEKDRLETGPSGRTGKGFPLGETEVGRESENAGGDITPQKGLGILSKKAQKGDEKLLG